MTDNIWQRKHILDVDDFSREDLEKVLQTTLVMKDVLSRPLKKVPSLRGRIVANMFYEPSTRTLSSFELAAKHLSADVINLSAASSSYVKGESLIDTMSTLEALGADVVVMRHSQSGAPYAAARHLKGSMINAGDGWHAHPSQALLDLFTIRQYKGQTDGLKVSIIGDIKHSRVARSNIWSLTKMGSEVTICGPQTLLPNCLSRNGDIFPEVKCTLDIGEALADADVVMMLRLQKERQ
ncbi:MAG: aspartate carbamoyltransferase catalytic subunit, partial [Chloroflexi bacterium]|nr:aspartate carbamoyltransferase catalytic subunit [Chloroflexota bacterium]